MAKEDRNVGAIVGALLRVAPALLDDLPKAALKRVAASVEVRSFGHGEVIFNEGDAPTGYFFIVAGSVSIYKKAFSYGDEDEDEEVPPHFDREGERIKRLGDRVAELGAGAGFGSFAFGRSGKELRRTASVVSDGDLDPRDAPLREAPKPPDEATTKKEKAAREAALEAYVLPRSEAAEFPAAHFLVVPNTVYVRDLSKSADGLLQRKIALLERCLLFDGWAIELL